MARLVCLTLLFLTTSHVALAARRGLWEVDRELDDMLEYLDNYGYSTLRKLLKKHDLDHALMNLLQNGTQITLLAPDNDAFASTPNCGLDVKEVLLDHVIPELLTERKIKDADVGSKVHSVGKDWVEKIDDRPLKVKLSPGKHHKGGGDKSHARRQLDENHDTLWPATHADVSTSKAAPVHAAAKGHHQKGGHHAHAHGHHEHGHGHHQDKNKHGGGGDDKHGKKYQYASEAEITNFDVLKSKNILVHHLNKVLTLCAALLD